MLMLINEQAAELCHCNDLLQVQFSNSIEGNFFFIFTFVRLFEC